MFGRKRFVAVDSLGLIWAALVTTADVQDRDDGCWLLQAVRGRLARMRQVIADAGFTKRFIDWVRRWCGWQVTTTHNAPEGFGIHPRRWVVEPTFAWVVRYRQFGKDHEFMTETSEAMNHAAMSDRMIRRLHRPGSFKTPCQTYTPDVIFMDIGMPGMDGYEAARRIREQPGLGNVVLPH